MAKLDPTIRKQLKALQGLWQGAEPKRGIQELPEAVYKGVITNAQLAQSKKGNLQVVWDLKVTAGPKKGATIKRFNQMATEENMGWLHGDLLTLGLEPDGDDIESIAEVLPEAVDLAILFRVRTKDEYINIDFVDVLSGDEAETDGDGTDEEDTNKAKKGKGKDKDEPADEDPDADAGSGSPTKVEVRALTGKKLRTLAKDCDVDPDDYDDDDRKIQSAIIKELGL